MHLREKQTDSQGVSQMQTPTHTNFSGRRQNNQTYGEEKTHSKVNAEK